MIDVRLLVFTVGLALRDSDAADQGGFSELHVNRLGTCNSRGYEEMQRGS